MTRYYFWPEQNTYLAITPTGESPQSYAHAKVCLRADGGADIDGKRLYDSVPTYSSVWQGATAEDYRAALKIALQRQGQPEIL